jgi:hypothetical protein
MTKNSSIANRPGLPARLVPHFATAIDDLKQFGPMKKRLFIKYYTRALLDYLVQSRDLKIRDSHIGEVVVLNLYKYPKCYETHHTVNTLTSSLILRAALERLYVPGQYDLVTRSSTSAWITRSELRTLVLARHAQPTVRLVRLLLARLQTSRPDHVIIVVPVKKKNFYRKITGYEISILELGRSFLPVHDN